jgi:hypothetical protein
MSSDEQLRDDDDNHAALAGDARGGPTMVGPAEFAHEDELRHQSEAEPLAGCDVEHCQRMHE